MHRWYLFFWCIYNFFSQKLFLRLFGFCSFLLLPVLLARTNWFSWVHPFEVQENFLSILPSFKYSRYRTINFSIHNDDYKILFNDQVIEIFEKWISSCKRRKNVNWNFAIKCNPHQKYCLKGSYSYFVIFYIILHEI